MAYTNEGAAPSRPRGLSHAPRRRHLPVFDARRNLSALPRPRPSVPTSFPEIDCVRHLLPLGFAQVAEWRSVQVGIGADRVLVTAGHIEEETYLRALAASLDIPFEPLDETAREDCPLADDELAQAAVAGLLPLYVEGGRAYAVAPRGLGARTLIRLLDEQPEMRARLRLTSAERLADYVTRHGMAAIGRHAADFLKVTQPVYSAAARLRPGVLALLALMAFAGGMLAAPMAVVSLLGLGLSVFFMAWILFRLAAALVPAEPPPPLARMPDDRLPAYTIIVALYREAAVVGDLVGALRKLDYPPEKLQVMLVLEPDDHDTRDAVARLRPGAPFEIVIAPDVGPRTKPKALNVALALARGTYTAVYDAEDRPEPDQLRRAIDAFDKDARLACVQARLTIDNTADGCLTRLFTAEYAGLFDVFLPAISAHNLPLPLGGSSNHFRTSVLRAVGGWDPYNVTEDADLGMRLARQGHRTIVIASTTFEEAPARLVPWLKQRTRWFKGWLQTWLVHMRRPRLLLADLGVAGFLAFQLMVGGTVLAALVHPLFAILLAMGLLGGPGVIPDRIASFTGALSAATLVAGYVTSGLLGAIGLRRRGLGATAWWLVLMPLHWVMLSVAAWRALIHLVRDPYRWEKTEHGAARTSRLAPLPAAGMVRYTVSDRRRPLRASA